MFLYSFEMVSFMTTCFSHIYLKLKSGCRFNVSVQSDEFFYSTHQLPVSLPPSLCTMTSLHPPAARPTRMPPLAWSPLSFRSSSLLLSLSLSLLSGLLLKLYLYMYCSMSMRQQWGNHWGYCVTCYTESASHTED